MNAPESNLTTAPKSQVEQNATTAVWRDFAEHSGAILVVGHGTRNPLGANQLLDLVGQMQSQAPEIRIFGCFLELAEPSIEKALEQIGVLGIKKILIVPVLLFTAAHAKQDIPEAVLAAASRLGIEIVGQTESLGTHPAVLALSQIRYHEVSQLSEGNTCPKDACARVQCRTGRCEAQHWKQGRVGLAMVGRGTSDQQALAHMRNLTELKMAQLAAVTSQTGFFAGGRPNVDQLLVSAAEWDCETIIVQPHLLFEGDLIDQLRNKVLDCQQRWPNKNWLIARTLGADPKLAEVFLELAQEKLTTK